MRSVIAVDWLTLTVNSKYDLCKFYFTKCVVEFCIVSGFKRYTVVLIAIITSIKLESG